MPHCTTLNSSQFSSKNIKTSWGSFSHPLLRRWRKRNSTPPLSCRFLINAFTLTNPTRCPNILHTLLITLAHTKDHYHCLSFCTLLTNSFEHANCKQTGVSASAEKSYEVQSVRLYTNMSKGEMERRKISDTPENTYKCALFQALTQNVVSHLKS